MTSDERLYAALRATGIPGAKQAYPKGMAPPPPFFVYTVESRGETFADGRLWSEMPRYRVQLLEKQADAKVEKNVLDALEAEYGAVKVIEDWSQSEHARIISYYFTDTHNGRK